MLTLTEKIEILSKGLRLVDALMAGFLREYARIPIDPDALQTLADQIHTIARVAEAAKRC